MRTIFILVTLLCPAFATAQFDDSLSKSQTTKIREQLRVYFEESHDGLGPLLHLRPWIPIVDLLLKELLARETALFPADPKRTTGLMVLIHDLSASADMQLSADMANSLRLRLHPLLLLHPEPGEMRELVLETFDRFNLWSPHEIWYFLGITTSQGVITNYHRLRKLLPKINSQEKSRIVEHLRALRPLELGTLCAIFDTGQMREREMVTLFRLVSTQFAKILWRAGDANEMQLEFRLGDARDGLIGAKLKQLMKALQNGDVMVTSAFNKAVNQAARIRAAPYAREDRLWFFTLFQEGRLLWHDRDTWLREKGYIPLRDRFRTDGNVIRVEFAPGRRCEDKLTEN